MTPRASSKARRTAVALLAAIALLGATQCLNLCAARLCGAQPRAAAESIPCHSPAAPDRDTPDSTHACAHAELAMEKRHAAPLGDDSAATPPGRLSPPAMFGKPSRVETAAANSRITAHPPPPLALRI